MQPAIDRAKFIRELTAREPVLDRAKQADFSKAMERNEAAERFRTAMEFRDNMARGISNTGGFDASDLMKDPEMAQKSTRDQAEKVSEPYRQANMMAAEKTNPMNAESQDPGKTFLQDYLKPKDQGPLRSFESPMVPLLIPKR